VRSRRRRVAFAGDRAEHRAARVLREVSRPGDVARERGCSRYLRCMGVMTGKTVAITGASSGIGLATARGLAKLGARIVAVVRNRERAREALAELGDVEIITADLYSMGEVRLAGAELRRRVSRLD